MDNEQKKLAEELLFSDGKKPSFAKNLYRGIFDTRAVFPFPQPDPQEKGEVEAYVAQVKAFVEAEVDPVAIDRQSAIPDSVIQGLGKLGVLSMSIPPEYGGLGFSQYAYCRVMEALAAQCGSTALFVNAHQSVGMKALVLFGTPAQQQKWLPLLANGKAIAAFSLTEPQAGSDAAGILTTATYDPIKRVYRLNGQKQWTTNGSIAQLLTVMAKTEDQKVTAFLVTPDMPGFEVTAPALEKVGMRGTRTSNLRFENVEVPEENILGPKGKGLKVCLTVLDFGRTTFGATCTGVAKDLVQRATQHAVERHQFKRPLASFGLVKQKLAKMAAYTYAMESTTLLTASFIDRDYEDFMLETAMLKVFTSDSLWQIIYDTMQIFGGRSFFTDAPLERIMRDARLNMIGEGSNEVLRAFIGLVGLRDYGMQLKGIVEAPLRNFAPFIGHVIDAIIGADIPVSNNELKGEARQLKSSIRRLTLASTRVLGSYREEVIEQQLDLDRLATAGMALYTAIAVLSRLSTTSISEVDLVAGKLYCTLAFETFHNALDHLFHPTDQQILNLAEQLTGIS